MRLPPDRCNPQVNPILAVTAACRRRQRVGQSVVDLSVGQPDFPTPPEIGAAATQAIERGETRYPPLQGIGELRVALRRTLEAAGLGYSPREILVTAGATGALFDAFQALLEAGDRVLVPVPTYPSYADQIELAGGLVTPVATRAADGFKLRPETLRQAAVESGARLLVLNQPNNPTGAVYGRQQLAALAEVICDLDLDLISDEVYRDFVYASPEHTDPEETSLGHTSPVELGAEMKERTLVVGSLSKSYAMTGWRVGFAAGPAAVIKALMHVQEASLVGPATPCQWAAVAALDGDQAGKEAMVAAFARRHRYVRQRLQAMPGVVCDGAQGAFFAFPDLAAYTADSSDFCRRLLDHHGVAVVPGAAFGAPSCLRLSYAVEDADLEHGLDRFEAALSEIEMKGDNGLTA